MDDVTTLLSLTTGVFPIACKTESRIGLLYAMVFSPRPAAAYAFGIGCSKIHIGTRSSNWTGGDVVPDRLSRQRPEHHQHHSALQNAILGFDHGRLSPR